MAITADLYRLAADRIVELFELDATAIGGSVSRFCNDANQLGVDVVWQGNTYLRFPIEAKGFEFSGKGQIPRPTLRVANVTGLLGALVRDYDDLIGAKLTRRRTLVKYLDVVNFPAQRNLLIYSSVFSNAAWTQQNSIALTDNYAAAPDNISAPYSTTATRAVFPTATLARIFQTVIGLASQTVTFSIWLKSNTGASQSVELWLREQGFGTTYGSASVTVTTAWQRFSITATIGSGSTGVMAMLYHSGTGFPTWDVLMWGAQVEIAATASEYQPVGSVFSRNPTADPTAAMADDVYYIDRKANENKYLIEFELAASFDVGGVQLPRRVVIQNVCPWVYRGAECGYAGGAVAKADDTATAILAQDACGKRLSSCKLRFGTYAELPYGGFPSAGLIR